VSFDFQPNNLRSHKFSKAIAQVFNSSKEIPGESFTVQKYTPLEKQVVDAKAKYPDCLLMVECGYRFRFFGDDATAAAKVLSIFARKDHAFMVASVPTYRVLIHLRRLVAAGFKVALMRQTETAAMKKAKSSSGTFTRAITGIFTPATIIDDDDPSFSDLLLQSCGNELNDGNIDEGDDNSDVEGIDNDLRNGQDQEEDKSQGDFDEMWLLSICSSNKKAEICSENADNTPISPMLKTDDDTDVNYGVGTDIVADSDSQTASQENLALVAIDLKSHSLKHQLLVGTDSSVSQQLHDILDLLRPTEMIVANSVCGAAKSIVEIHGPEGPETSSHRCARVSYLRETLFKPDTILSSRTTTGSAYAFFNVSVTCGISYYCP